VGEGRGARIFLGDDFSVGADQVDAIATTPGLHEHRFDRMDPKADGYRTRSRRAGMRLVG
jgi:DNA polymerase-3 subunit alpha